MDLISIDQRKSTSESTPNQILKKLIPGLLFGFVVFIGLALAGDLRQVGEQVQGFRWPLLLPVIALVLWNYLLRFVKWQYFLGRIGVRKLPLRESARIFVAAFPLAVTPGKVGETLKGVWLNKESGIPSARGVSVVLAERIGDGLAMLVLSVLGVVAYPQYWPAFVAVLLLLTSVIVISQIRPLSLALLNFGERLPLIDRLSHSLHELYEGSYSLFRPGATLLSVGLGVVSWLAEGIALYVILLGLGVQPDRNTLAIAVFVLAFSTVIGAMSALPGGLLATDASIAGMLVLLLGLETGTAAAATLLIRLATLWFAVGLGLSVWLFSRKLLGLSENAGDSQTAQRVG
jgi:glycosyltransferase 2 family protein